MLRHTGVPKTTHDAAVRRRDNGATPTNSASAGGTDRDFAAFVSYQVERSKHAPHTPPASLPSWLDVEQYARSRFKGLYRRLLATAGCRREMYPLWRATLGDVTQLMRLLSGAAPELQELMLTHGSVAERMQFRDPTWGPLRAFALLSDYLYGKEIILVVIGRGAWAHPPSSSSSSSSRVDLPNPAPLSSASSACVFTRIACGMPGQLDVVRVATNALTLLPAALDLAADAIGSNWTKNPLNLVPPGFFPSIKRAVYSRIPEWMTFPVNLLPHGPTMVQGDHPNYGGTAPFYVPPALLPLALPMKVLWVSVPGLPSLTNYYMASGDASWVPSGGVKIGPDDFIPDDAVDWTRQSFSSGTPQSDSAAAGLHAAWDRMSPENQTRWWNQEGIYMVWDPDHPRVKAVASLLKAPIKTIGIMGGATFLVANPALAIPAATAVKAVVALGAVGTVLESVPTMVDLSSRQAFPYDEGIRKEILNLPSARERGHAIITKCTESGRCVLPWNKFAASLDRVEACAAARGFNQVAREYRISEFILSLEAGILIVAIDRTRRWRQAARRGANMDSKEVNDAISTGLFVELGMSTALGTFLFALYQVSGVAYGNFPLPGIITASTLGVYAFLLNMKGAPITTEQSSGITPAQITSVQERVATALATMNLKQYSNPANIPHGAIKAIVITAWAVHDILIGTYPVETLLYGVLQFLAVSLLDPVYIGTVFTDRMHPTTVALLTAADAADVLPRPVDSTLTQGPPNPGLSLLLWFHTALGVLNDPKLTWAATLRANPTFDFHQATSSASQHNNIRNAKVWNSDALRTAGAYRDLHPSVHPIFAYFGLAFGSTGVMEARRMFFTNLTTTTNSLNFATWLVEFLTPPAGLSAPLRLEMVVSALAWTVRCAAMVTVLTMDPYEYRGPTYA